MGWFNRRRLVVSNVLVGLEGEGRDRAFPIVAAEVKRIADEGDDFEVTIDALIHVAETLLELEPSWSHVANWGEVFGKEEDAATYAEECFADAAGRYLSSGRDEGGPSTEAGADAGRLMVVTLTVGYEGEHRAIEKTLATRLDLSSALSAIVSLAREGRVDLAHLHLAPAAPGDELTEDRLLMNYPELLGL